MKQNVCRLLLVGLLIALFVPSVAAAQGPIPVVPPPTPQGWVNRDAFGGVLLPVAPGHYVAPSENCWTCQVRADRDVWLYAAPNYYGIIQPVQTIPGGTVLTVRAVTNDFWFVTAGPWTGYFVDRSQTTRL